MSTYKTCTHMHMLLPPRRLPLACGGQAVNSVDDLDLDDLGLGLGTFYFAKLLGVSMVKGRVSPFRFRRGFWRWGLDLSLALLSHWILAPPRDWQDS